MYSGNALHFNINPLKSPQICCTEEIQHLHGHLDRKYSTHKFHALLFLLSQTLGSIGEGGGGSGRGMTGAGLPLIRESAEFPQSDLASVLASVGPHQTCSECLNWCTA